MRATGRLCSSAREPGRCVRSMPRRWNPRYTWTLGRSAIIDLKVSPNGLRLLAVMQDGTRIFDIATREEVAVLERPAATQAAFSPDGRFIATNSDFLRVWPAFPNTQDLDRLRTLGDAASAQRAAAQGLLPRRVRDGAATIAPCALGALASSCPSGQVCDSTAHPTPDGRPLRTRRSRRPPGQGLQDLDRGRRHFVRAAARHRSPACSAATAPARPPPSRC